MIHRLECSIEIKTEKHKIWNALWNDNMYCNWVSEFLEGSYAVTDDWKEGSKVLFLDPDKNGIFSNTEKHIPNETIKFKHIGMVSDEKEHLHFIKNTFPKALDKIITNSSQS